MESMLDGRWFDSHLSRRAREGLLGAIILGAIAVTFSEPPVLQDPAYNHFADERTFLGIPNFLDVVSNLGMLIVGLRGVLFLVRLRAEGFRPAFSHRSEAIPYFIFYVGLALTAFGSAYYHWSPSDNRLVWDRLPMTIVFMSWIALTIGERVDRRAGLLCTPLLLGVGAGSVVTWHLSELRGSGDLRAYLDVQYLATLAIPMIAVLFPSRYTQARTTFKVFWVYLLAKLFEVFDPQVYSLGHIVSGHTVKHVLAAVAANFLLQMLRGRHALPARPPDSPPVPSGAMEY